MNEEIKTVDTDVLEFKNHKKSVFFFKFFLLFALVSFIGWAWEVVYFLIQDNKLLDRGFLSLGWCPVYGLSILAIYFTMGTPNKTRGILKPIHNVFLRYILYFIVAALISTIIEFAAGYIFLEYLGKSLWSYSGNPYNFMGIICLWISLLWGFLITIGMRLIFYPILNKMNKLQDETILVFGISVSIVFLFDLIVSFIGLFLELKAKGVIC